MRQMLPAISALIDFEVICLGRDDSEMIFGSRLGAHRRYQALVEVHSDGRSFWGFHFLLLRLGFAKNRFLHTPHARFLRWAEVVES